MEDSLSYGHPAIGHVFFAAVKETKNASVRKARQGRKTGYRRRVSKNIRCGAALFAVPRGDRRIKR